MSKTSKFCTSPKLCLRSRPWESWTCHRTGIRQGPTGQPATGPHLGRKTWNKSKTPSPTWKHLSICFTKPIWSKNRYTIDELSMGHTRNAMMVKIYRRFSWDGHRSSSTRSRGPKRWSDKSPRCGLRPFSVLPPFGEGHLRTSKSTSQVSQVFVAGTKCIKARLTQSPASTVRLRSSVSVRFLLRPYGSGTTRLKA